MRRTLVGLLTGVLISSAVAGGITLAPYFTLGSTLVSLGQTVTSISGLTLPSPTFSGTVAGSGTIPNAVLANSSVTVAGKSVALGASTTVACSDLSNGTTGCSTAAFSSQVLIGTAPSNPTGTTSSTGVMMGLGSTCTITPTTGTRILIAFVITVSNNTVADGVFVNVRTGTGTAPTNGAAATGTQRTQSQSASNMLAGQSLPFSQTVVVTGLTPGTAVWFDIVLGVLVGGTAVASNITCSAIEL